VAAFVDDDLEYVAGHLGHRRIVIGSDWGHFDAGSDLECHRTVAERRQDVGPELARAIVDANPRDLFGIPVEFRPTESSVTA
jgi:hypothetical protein